MTSVAVDTTPTLLTLADLDKSLGDIQKSSDIGLSLAYKLGVSSVLLENVPRRCFLSCAPCLNEACSRRCNCYCDVLVAFLYLTILQKDTLCPSKLRKKNSWDTCSNMHLFMMFYLSEHIFVFLCVLPNWVSKYLSYPTG